MTPEYIASKLSLLPRFHVERLDQGTKKHGGGFTLTGKFSEPVDTAEGGASLFLQDLRYLYSGSISASTSSVREIEFVDGADFEVSLEELKNNQLTYFGATYDRRHITLVLDSEIQWEKIDFQPYKALAEHFTDQDGKRLRKLSAYTEGDQIPDGAWLVEEGWDHEHCVFCWDKIDNEHFGYRSHHDVYENEWVCQWCYSHAVSKHDPRPLISNYKDRK
jgi:hypothetical protein